MSLVDKLNFNEKGLIPAVIQDHKKGKVLTLCYMNKEALDKTLAKGKIYVFRRSAGKIMLKGEVSGNVQAVKEIFVDCAGNSLLFRVEQKVAACHEGYFTCYFRQVDKNGNAKITEKRKFNPDDVYKR